MKLYTDDRNLSYTSTKLKPMDTKHDIDAILARWGITKIAWEFNLEENRVVLQFELSEKFQDQAMTRVVRLEPPRIWDRRKKGRPEEVNWAVSMRILHWYVKDTLAMAYAMQSDRILAFLPHIQVDEEHTVKDVILPELSNLKALPSREEIIVEK